MPFDLGRSLRALKPQKRTGPLRRRPDDDLCWASDLSPLGPPLLLDTTVYIDVLQGRTPTAVDDLLTSRVCHHSAVCLAELTHAFGRLEPGHGATRSTLNRIANVIAGIPAHRLHAPNATLWGDAGIIAGMLFRLSGLPAGTGHERRFANDALVALQARSLGVSVLTGNVGDFDHIEQIIGAFGLIVYRTSGRAAS